jgi:hypothetical protein
MSATLLFRIAAGLLVFFAAGHTVGSLSFKPPTPEGMAVREAMNSVQFSYQGALYTYGGFYKGFSLSITAYMLFSAYLAWYLGQAALRQPQSIGSLAWAFAFLQLVGLALSIKYFFLPPALISGVVVICVAWAAWLARTASQLS